MKTQLTRTTWGRREVLPAAHHEDLARTSSPLSRSMSQCIAIGLSAASHAAYFGAPASR